MLLTCKSPKQMAWYQASQKSHWIHDNLSWIKWNVYLDYASPRSIDHAAEKPVGDSSNTSMTTYREPKKVSRSLMRMKSKLAYFYQDKKTWIKIQERKSWKVYYFAAIWSRRTILWLLKHWIYFAPISVHTGWISSANISTLGAA